MSKVLVVVDMQNDFISGSLGTQEAQGIVSRVADKIRARREEGYDIFVTMDTHESDYLQTQEGRNLPVEHCIRGSQGWQMAEEIADAVGDCPRFEKDTFGSRELALKLSEMAPESIEFVGLCTDICVVSNVLCVKAWLPETPISVDSSCCAGVTPESHQAALQTMASCQIKIERA